jgi:hypothetical protein
MVHVSNSTNMALYKNVMGPAQRQPVLVGGSYLFIIETNI